jgi:hypothetical protein
MILALDRVAEVEAWLRVWFRGFVVRGSWFALLPCSLTI